MTRNDDAQGDVGVDATDVDRYTRECRWEGDRPHRPSQVVVTTVANATGREPSQLRPLFEVIDPDALDALFERNATRSDESADGVIAFEYEGCDVRVEAGGRMVVTTLEGDG